MPLKMRMNSLARIRHMGNIFLSMIITLSVLHGSNCSTNSSSLRARSSAFATCTVENVNNGFIGDPVVVSSNVVCARRCLESSQCLSFIIKTENSGIHCQLSESNNCSNLDPTSLKKAYVAGIQLDTSYVKVISEVNTSLSETGVSEQSTTSPSENNVSEASATSSSNSNMPEQITLSSTDNGVSEEDTTSSSENGISKETVTSSSQISVSEQSTASHSDTAGGTGACDTGTLNTTSPYAYPTYQITTPTALAGKQVLRDTNTTTGDWMLIQRRSSGVVDFYRDWADYKVGFGSLDTEFWVGLDTIHTLTSGATYELRFDMVFGGVSAYAHYDTFSIGNEADNYTIQIGVYDGTAGGDSMNTHRGMPFTTLDRDNDLQDGENCGVEKSSGWWFSDCSHVNMNGKWGEGNKKGAEWRAFTNGDSVTFSEMKIRCVSGS